MISEQQRWINSVIKGFFVRPADANYIIARWCFLHGLVDDFFWNAAQAIEKYLKASLVLNGFTAYGYGHNLISLHDGVSAYAMDFIPNVLICPKRCDREAWRTELTSDWLDRINHFGSPNGMYGLISNWMRPDDLIKLDGYIFSIRRLAIRLEDVCVHPDKMIDKSLTNLQVISEDRDWQPCGDLQIPQQALRAEAVRVEDAIDCLNFAFSDRLPPLSIRLPSLLGRNSWVAMLASDADEVEPREDDMIRADAIEWLLSRVPFPKDYTAALIEARDKLRQRSE